MLEPSFQRSEPWTSDIRHRGPDAQASWSEPPAAFHFARLKILDLTDQGMQPMISRCGRYVMVYNGEIVNFQELARQYGLQLRSRSDSEVLLELFARKRTALLSEIRGMFACVIFDRRERSVLAFRDPFGIKPLYWTQAGETLMLASQMAPILRAIGGSEISDSEVIRFLKRGELDDGERTLFTRIRQIPPGHWLSWKSGVPSIHRYLEIPVQTEPPPNEEEVAHRYYETLVRNVGEYLHADVPVGVALSGGFDSSLLAHLVRAHMPQGKTLPMFTRGYRGYDGNEFEAARRVGKRFGFEAHPVVLTPEEIPDSLVSVSRRQEHPITSISVLAFHKLYAEAHRAGVRVLLEGQGGDEIWAGYAYYADMSLQDCSQDGSSFALNGELIRPNLTDQESSSPWKETVGAAAEFASPFLARQLSDLYGPKLQRALRFVDRASMSIPVEVRVPYLDREVALPALALPDAWKVREGIPRHFIRQIAITHLGLAVARRPKVAVQDPQRVWLQRQIKPYVWDLLHSQGLFIEAYVDVARLRRRYEEFLEHPDRFDNLTFVMFPIFLEAWHQAVRDAACTTPSMPAWS